MSDAVKLICAQDEIAHLRSEVDRFRAEVIRLGGLLNASPWIPCGERMPEGTDSVLFVVAETERAPAFVERGIHWGPREYYPDGYWTDDREDCDTYKPERVTHWMPLPEPP